jgi:hypothetical protein
MSRVLAVAVVATACVVLPGCHSLLDVPLPPGTVDPAALASINGALAIRNEALIWLTRNYAGSGRLNGGIVYGGGLLADEFSSGGVGFRFGDPNYPISGDVTDRRIMSNAPGGYPGQLSDVVQFRQYAMLAIAAIRANHNPGYGPMVAEMFLVEGLSELFLAEDFCSGVALSDIVPGGDLRYGSPMTNAQMFTRAAADFDSALVQLTDSASAPGPSDATDQALAQRVQMAARIAKARALLGAGQYTQIAAVTASVPDDFVYAVQYDASNNTNVYQLTGYDAFTVSDREGGNGLPFRSAHDPRLQIVNTDETLQFDMVDSIYRPSKFNGNGATPIPLLSGIEARLIEAEAALGTNDVATWLDRINHLRSTMVQPAMADTTDPRTADGRLSLMFYERGFWLFGTGHRLGDLRRLVKLYGRPAPSVFPNGQYVAGADPSQGFGPNYGTDIGFGIPASELQNNPHSQSCASGT